MNNNKGLPCNSNGVNKIIHIHPSLQCNLFCKHCYSESSPQLKNSLALEKIQPFLEYARLQGYNILSISGGEPFLYRNLYELTSFSKQLGFHNMVVSNGMLLASDRNKKTLENIDLIAISIDGNKELHDDMRNFTGAFDKMLTGVSVLREMNKSYGFIHTITEKSWKQLLWIADFAQQNGARLLQFHPLENFGRAKHSFNYSLSQETMYKSYILYHYIRDKYQEDMFVQLDYIHKQHLKDLPELVSITGGDGLASPLKKLHEFINTIIIEEQGDIVPIAYGFSRDFIIGNLHQFDAADDIFGRFVSTKASVLQAHYQQAYDYVMSNDEEMINWNELIVEISNSRIAEAV
jgi:Fe-coproporphyrin III synthase